MVILKVTKNQGFTLSLDDTFLKKPQGGVDMLEKFKNLNVHMSIKIHFLFSHLHRFPENFEAVSDEQGEGFHQDIKAVEQRYQGRWDSHMMVGCCWTIMRENISS